MKDIDISIIILSYNTAFLTKACIESVLRSNLKNISIEIIVVDNNSTDDSVSKINIIKSTETILLVKNNKNLGFAAGNNIGINRAKGRYILLLNSDTEIDANTLKVMVQFMDRNPKVGAATCRINFPDGKIDPACHRGFPTPWAAITYFLGIENYFPKIKLFSGYHLWYKDISTIHEIDSPSGAFMMVKRDVINQIGLLDERFFMYGEDLDWAFRIKKAGWTIMYNPVVNIIHYKKQSGRLNNDKKIRRASDQYFYDTMKLFYNKHYKSHYGTIITNMINMGIWILSKIKK